MNALAVLGRLVAFLHAVVPDDVAYPQPVGAENATAPLALRLAVLLQVAPVAHRILVAPERERDEALRVRDALEALDRDEAVELAHLLAQSFGERLVVGETALGRGELEDDRNHAFPLV